MKTFLKITFFSLAILIRINHAAAPDKGTGIGIIIGEPTGLSAKMWTSSGTALDAGLAWSFGKDGRLHLHADHLWHNFKFIRHKKFSLYYGLGAEINLGSVPVIGVRGLVGVDYFFNEIPLDAFFEIVPVFTVLPGSGFSGGAGIGLRWFF